MLNRNSKNLDRVIVDLCQTEDDRRIMVLQEVAADGICKVIKVNPGDLQSQHDELHRDLTGNNKFQTKCVKDDESNAVVDSTDASLEAREPLRQVCIKHRKVTNYPGRIKCYSHKIDVDTTELIAKPFYLLSLPTSLKSVQRILRLLNWCS